MEPIEVCQGCIIVCLSENSLVNVYNIINQLKDSSWSNGTNSHYIALVADHCKDSIPFNVWLKCAQSPPITPPTPSPRRPISHYMTLSELDDCLRACQSEAINKRREDHITNEIHWLLDHRPWSSDEYMLMTVVVIISGTVLASASTEMYGALLRLRSWNNASVYFITDERVTDDLQEDGFTWKDLSVSLPAHITSSNSNVTQALSSNILWKGPLRIPEHKSKNCPTPLALVLPGFMLSLDDHDNSPSRLFYEVGFNINHTHYPSHLELVKIIDINDIPLLWLSPLAVKISIDPSFEDTPSYYLFKDNFQSPPSSTGMLLRLYMKSTIESRNQFEYNTEQWRLHILEKEIMCGNNPMSSALSSLSDYYPGPLLLILPRSTLTKSESCDARLLWKPQAMLNVGTTFKQLFLMERSLREEPTDVEQTLCNGHVTDHVMQNGCTQKKSDIINGTQVMRSNRIIYNKNGPSSNWPEIIALNTLEAITRKQIKRKNTSELTLGGVAAPPPSGTSMSFLATTDLLECFTDDGRAKLELSPVPMNEVSEDGIPSLHMIDPSGSSVVSYKQALDSTPTTARRYHGVSYCFNEEDSSRDCKLMKIQKQFIASERSSNCSDYRTPVKNTELKNRKKQSKALKNATSKSVDEISGSVADQFEPQVDQPQPQTVRSQSQSHAQTNQPQPHTKQRRRKSNNNNNNQSQTNNARSRSTNTCSNNRSRSTTNTCSNNRSRSTTTCSNNRSDSELNRCSDNPPGNKNPRSVTISIDESCRRKRMTKCTIKMETIGQPNVVSLFSIVKQEIQTSSSSPMKATVNYSTVPLVRSSTTNEEEYTSTQRQGRTDLPNDELRLEKSFEKLRTSKARRSLCISGDETLKSNTQNSDCSQSTSDNNNNTFSASTVPDESCASSHVMVDSTNRCKDQSSKKRLSLPSNLSTTQLEEHDSDKSVSIATSSVLQLHNDNLVSESNSNHDSQPVDANITSVKTMKKILERAIVMSLKSHTIKHDHICFKSCYVKLFKVCKVYVKDLKPMPLDVIKKQINKIVECNVQQVIDFELPNGISVQ